MTDNDRLDASPGPHADDPDEDMPVDGPDDENVEPEGTPE